MLYSVAALIVGAYTAVFAYETWRSGNRFGGIVIFILAVLAVALPVAATVMR